MSLKWTIILSVVWVLIVMIGCLAVLWYIWENRVWPRYGSEERIAAFGRGAGLFTAISLVPLWIYWAVQHRKRRT
jgi:hypothetical protein